MKCLKESLSRLANRNMGHPGAHRQGRVIPRTVVNEAFRFPRDCGEPRDLVGKNAERFLCWNASRRILTSPTKIRARLFSTLSHSITRTYDYFPLDIARTQLYTEAQSIEGVAPTMRNIEDPRQERLFDPFQGLFPPLARRILDNGWQGTFRLVILESLPVAKLSEHFHPSLGTPTKELYSMAGLVFLADFHGWTSQQAIEAYMFHTDVQFALNVEPGVQVCTRTVERYQELFLEDDLAALTFKNVTETLVKKLEQDVSLQRLDSTHVFSHMATFGRTKLMAVAIKRFLVQ